MTPEQLEALRSIPLSASVPNRLRIAMSMTRSTNADVAAGTGLHPTTISEIANGKYEDLKHSTVQSIASFFGARIEDIFPAREVLSA